MDSAAQKSRYYENHRDQQIEMPRSYRTMEGQQMDDKDKDFRMDTKTLEKIKRATNVKKTR